MRADRNPAWRSALEWLELVGLLTGGVALVAAVVSFVYVKTAGASSIVISLWR